MKNMRFKVGDRVRIKGIDWYNKNKDKSGSVFANGIPFCEEMSEYCGAYVTIAEVYNDHYAIRGVPYCWTDGMIECLTDAHCKLGIVPTEKGSELIPREGFEIKQEGEKFYLVKKKKEFPKTYEECCAELNNYPFENGVDGYKFELLSTFQKLLICRDAYWKIAGEEMGLGKPWEPDWGNPDHDSYPTITRCGGKIIRTTIYTHDCPFAFPTPEMRDAFKENFDPDIEFCKELL